MGRHALRHLPVIAAILAAAAFLASALATPLSAEQPTMDELVAAIVKVKTFVPADARSAQTLGAEREGTGVLIDGNGLIVTIGYLILEAERVELTGRDSRKIPAEIVGYDYESGFGLLRAAAKLAARPIKIGESAEVKVKDRVLAINYAGADGARPALVVARRVFAGYWEYMLENAIFTAPPIMEWGGAALIAQDGRLVGIGSLIVNDPMDAGSSSIGPGNMFIPIDELKPIMADLLTQGRPSSEPRPWLGINSEEVRGRLFITRVSPGTPAEKAGLKQGDLILGVGGKPVTTLAEFYRALWASGPAGVDVKLNILQGISPGEITVKSGDRYRWLKLNRSY
ncbi:MAG: serine protease [Alphaproteobacteria bacterium]|nr:serine protease [Alphaproteobacteria bacterium]